MRRIKASIAALILAFIISVNVALYKPSDHEVVSESPTTQTSAVKPFDDALSAPKPVIVAEDSPLVDAESTQVKPEPKPQTIEVVSTFYVSDCRGCSGITASGYDVGRTIYYGEYRIIAADKSIALGTKVYVELADGQAFKAIVLDRGGSIKGARIDVLVATYDEAIRLGRQQAKVTILK